MLWPREKPPSAPARRAVVEPAPLAVRFSDALFERHFKGLLAAAEDREGVEAWLDALGEKQRRLALALEQGNLVRVIDLVFGARRKLGHLVDDAGFAAGVGRLGDDALGLEDRIAAAISATPVDPGETREARRAAARLRRAAHDLAAEVLHFRDPVRVPLMTRWVWDQATMSGALRELAHGGEAARSLALDNRAGTYEAARRWLLERVSAQGIYRDVHFWADLVLASAYGHYFRSMTGGVLGSDFQRATHPAEAITGLLGIDRILREASRAHP
jgi:hypothetical protein